MLDARIIAIVVNWKLKEATLECVQSLAQLDVPCHIIVVDNGSNDGSVNYILQHCSQVEVIALPSNDGFAVACNHAMNRALSEAACEYVLLLNSDAIIHPHALSILLFAAHEHPSAGILGPKIYYRDRPNVIWYAGARRQPWSLLATSTGRGCVDRGQYQQVCSVDYVFGAAMLIRRQVLEQIGIFDERFFLYLEDLDFCLRAQAASFKLLFVPDANVWHTGSASTANDRGWRRYHMARSCVGFVRKYAPTPFIIPLLIVWILAFLDRIIGDLKEVRPCVVHQYWLGLLSGMTGTTNNGGSE
jgi:GT2 family glycosyltransferase